jgi:predicted DNA-binding transcriptional regulator AlpA
MAAPTSAVKFISLPMLRQRWSCSHMLIERLMKNDPDFPNPIKLGSRKRLWSVEEIEAFERSKIVARLKTEEA